MSLSCCVVCLIVAILLNTFCVRSASGQVSAVTSPDVPVRSALNLNTNTTHSHARTDPLSAASVVAAALASHSAHSHTHSVASTPPSAQTSLANTPEIAMKTITNAQPITRPITQPHNQAQTQTQTQTTTMQTESPAASDSPSQNASSPSDTAPTHTQAHTHTHAHTHKPAESPPVAAHAHTTTTTTHISVVTQTQPQAQSDASTQSVISVPLSVAALSSVPATTSSVVLPLSDSPVSHHRLALSPSATSARARALATKCSFEVKREQEQPPYESRYQEIDRKYREIIDTMRSTDSRHTDRSGDKKSRDSEKEKDRTKEKERETDRDRDHKPKIALGSDCVEVCFVRCNRVCVCVSSAFFLCVCRCLRSQRDFWLCSWGLSPFPGRLRCCRAVDRSTFSFCRHSCTCVLCCP